MARPRSEIDREKVKRLAAIDCTNAEIAAVMGVSINTLERRCRQEIADGRERGKASIRRKQFKLAMEGNPAMLIWLGKQRLGQADKQDMTMQMAVNPVEHFLLRRAQARAANGNGSSHS
jgi:hypothetical protein